jgi:outer membrane receptor protein involved in Fe transport
VYELQVELAGFTSQVRRDLVFSAGQRVVLNVSMRLSSIQETITVTGAPSRIQTTSAEVSALIDNRALETLPIRERNYFRLLTLDSNIMARSPGVNTLYTGGGDAWNFGTYVDGVNNHSKWSTLQRAPQQGSSGFSLETVKEIQVTTNQSNAEFGGHSSGVASMITKSGTNTLAGSAIVFIRPGALDAKPPLSPTAAPYNQQQFGGTVGGPAIRDHLFYFGSYERRRERSSTVVTSPAAFGDRIQTPADEHQGLIRGDARFNERHSMALRYNMVRWRKDNEIGGLNLRGTGFIWDNNIDTIQGTFTSVPSSVFLNEARVQWSRYYDLRSAKCECVRVMRAGYSNEGGVALGTWGVIPEDTWDVANAVSLWRGNHSVKVGASLTYDVTTQLYQPNQNGIYVFRGAPDVAPTPFQFIQSFALDSRARLMKPQAYVVGTFAQDDWRIRNNVTLNLGLRYDVEILKGIPHWPAPVDKNNLDPRVGFAWDPTGEQKWSVRGGVGRFTQQHPIFTVVTGAILGRHGIATLGLPAGDPNFPVFPNVLPAFPPNAVLPARNIQEISDDLENEQSWQVSAGFQRQISQRSSLSVDASLNRGQKHGFLDVNQPRPISKDVINAANGAVVRTVPQADQTRPVPPAPNGFRRIDLLTNEGRYWYQGVRTMFQHRSAMLWLSVSYTLSKAEEQLNHWDPPEDSSNPELDRALGYADSPHNLVAAATWTLPGSGPLLGGWRLSGIVQAHSGHPYPVRYGADLTGTTIASCSPRGCGITQPGSRNTLRAEPVQYVDMTIARTFALPAANNRIEFRADVFNLFNNQNYVADGYIGVVGNPSYGQPTAGAMLVWPGRQFQFGATYRF